MSVHDPSQALPFTHDLIVVGAGPAGMAAATTAASLGLRTILLDEQSAAGGQIYRNVSNVASSAGSRAAILGKDFLYGASLVDQLKHSGATCLQDALVWDVAPDLTVTAMHRGTARQLRAPQLIAATGAMERASPIPGWTLPGVMNAGAAQIALKCEGLVPAGPVVLAGGGPLLLLVACQLLQAGAQVAAIVETTAPSARRAALAHAASALRAWPYLAKGLSMMRRLRAARVPWFRGATALRVMGALRAEGLAFEAQGRPHTFAATTVLLHHGVVPNTQLTRLLRVEHVWDDVQLAWHVVRDETGQTSMKGFRIAGDGAAIDGALAAEASGTLAALGAAHALGKLSAPDASRRMQPLKRTLEQQRRIRPFLDVLYRPPPWIVAPSDDTIVCRCEEVTAGRVREMARLGCQGPNQTKFFSRCGMGPCQGRVCGGVVTQILAAELGRSAQEVGAYRIRAPLKPVPMQAIAGLHLDGPNPDASQSVKF